MHVKIVSVHRDGWILELYDDLDALAIRLGGEVQQGMFVESKLVLNALETGGGKHGEIVKQWRAPGSEQQQEPRLLIRTAGLQSDPGGQP
jgi:hypothetical protein